MRKLAKVGSPVDFQREFRKRARYSRERFGWFVEHLPRNLQREFRAQYEKYQQLFLVVCRIRNDAYFV